MAKPEESPPPPSGGAEVQPPQSGTAVTLVKESTVSLGALNATSASEVIERASTIATALKAVIDKQNLFNMISGKRHVRVEGWTTLGTMLNCSPYEVSVVEHPCTLCEGGCKHSIFEATVEMRSMADGRTIARASMECGSPDELDSHGSPVWADRPRYARRSMAITRATSKACRLAFSWIMTMAGYEATPAEEVPAQGFGRGGEQQAETIVVTMETAIPFGKHSARRRADHKALTVKQAGRKYFVDCMELQPDQSGKSWFKFCAAAVEAFDLAAEDARAEQAGLEDEPASEPGNGDETATAATVEDRMSDLRGQITKLLNDPEVPDKSKGIYRELFKPTSTLDDLSRIATNLAAWKDAGAWFAELGDHCEC